LAGRIREDFLSDVTEAEPVTFPSNARPHPVDTSWFFRALEADQETGLAILEEVIVGINSLIKAQRFGLLNSMLEDMPTAVTSQHILLALARSTFAVRSKLPKWKPFVLRVKLGFEARGLDANRLLMGLI
jgi:hypothetical protein